MISTSASESLLMHMLILNFPLRLDGWSLLLDILKGSHRVTIKATCKLQRTVGLSTANIFDDLSIISTWASGVVTWCTLKANRTPWSISSSSSGPPCMASSSEETLLRYFIASFTDCNLICTLRLLVIGVRLLAFCTDKQACKPYTPFRLSAKIG